MGPEDIRKLSKIIIVCLYIQGCCGNWDPAPTQRSTTPQCFWCPKKTTTRRTTTTHSTTHSTLHTTHNSTIHTTTHTNYTTTPHPTTPTNHTSTPHPTNHTTTPTNYTSTPHPTNHTTTPVPTNYTSTPHPTTHTNHTSTPYTTAHANNTTPHLITTSPTNHTTYPPTTAPPTEYVVNGSAGVCLRISASFKISNNKTKQEIVILPGPKTHGSGNCSAEKAWLTLRFPQGQVAMTFRKDKEGNNFFLGEVNITLKSKESETFDNASIKVMVTPLGRAFTCDKVDAVVTPNVSLILTNVKAQALKLNGGNYGKEMKCSNGSHNMTVPIVVGVILVVLILIVVIAYIVARQRSHRGYQPL